MEETKQITRQEKIEKFLLDPNKEIFNSLQEFNESVDYIKSLLGNLDLNELEKIQGQDGKTPVLGVDFLTDEDLDKIEAFIQDRIKMSWSEYPTKEVINYIIESKVSSEVAKIPRVKGDPGVQGNPGENGSPDTAEQIIEKLRSLSKNKKLNVSDIRGLQNELNRIAQEGESSLEELRKEIGSYRIAMSAPSGNSGGISDINGLITEGTNITITGSGTLADPFVINAAGAAAGDVVGPASAVADNIPVFNGTTGKLIKDGGKKISDLELVSNKSTNVTTDGASDTKYPSVKAIKDYTDGLVAGLLDYRGAYDASVNTFPASGGSGTAGAVLKGDTWVVSVAGTLGGVAIQVGDWVIANVDTPGQTTGNWDKLNTNLAYVPEDVANKSTSVTTDQASNTKYPSVKSVYDWAVGLFATISNLALKAPIASPTFTGIVTTPAIKITGGTPGLGKVLTSDADGDGTWETPSAGGSTFWTLLAGATRVSDTTFTVTGDQTALIKKGMIIKWTESSTVRVAMVSIPSTYGAPDTTITIIGDTMASIDASSLKYCMLGVEMFQKNFALAGTLGATGTDVANAYYATEPMRVIGMDLQHGTAGVTTTFVMDCNKNGTTMFTTKPSLATTVASSPLPFTADSATSLALGDRVSIDIDTINTGTLAIDLYAQLYLLPTRYINLT